MTETRRPLFLIAQFVALGMLWIAWQTNGDTALEPDYFAFPLIVPCVVAIGGIMAVASVRNPGSLRAGLLLPIAALPLAFIPGIDLLGRIFSNTQLTTLSEPVWAAVMLGIALLVAFAAARARPFLLLAAIALFEIYFPPFFEASLAYAGPGPFSTYRSRYSAFDSCSINTIAFNALLKIDQFGREQASNRRVWMWLGPREAPIGTRGCPIRLEDLRSSSVSLSFTSIGNTKDDRAAQIPVPQITAIQPDEWVAILTADRSDTSDLPAAFAISGRPLGPARTRDLVVDGSHLVLKMMPVLEGPGRPQ